MQYTLQVDSTAAYNVAIRHTATANQPKIKLSVDSQDRSPVTILSSTTGWSTVVIPDVILYKGVQKLKFMFEKGGANFSYMKFTLSKKPGDVPLTALSAETIDAHRISISFNKPIDGATVSANGLSMTINGTGSNITEVKPDPAGNTRLLISTEKETSDGDNIKINYNADAIKATDGTLLQDFSGLQVKNTLPAHLAIPGIVEAENFMVNQGLQLENTTDTGGGQNIGYTNAGDYLEYLIRVAEESEYSVEVRVASNSQAGRLEVQQLSRDKVLLSSVVLDVPVTGGWQKWKTINTKMNLQPGTGILKVKILQPEFNINWFRFSKSVISGVKDNRQGSLKIYPNPVDGLLSVEMPEPTRYRHNKLLIRSLAGNIIAFHEYTIHDVGSIDVAALPSGVYIIELQTGGSYWSNKFIVR